MQNIALRLAFDGTRYHGWQIQKNAVSVCGVLKEALEKTVGHAVTVHGCGRTDAGVHARVYTANFRSDTRIPPERLPMAVQTRLPRDIVVSEARVMPDGFDALGSLAEKEYTYYIHTGRFADPFLHNRAYHYPYPMDLAKIRAAADGFVGRHDFACVRTMGSPVKTTVRNLKKYDIIEERGLIAFRMRADGFLYNMARALVGTVLYAGEGKIESIPALIASGDRSKAGPVLPACGLYMTDAVYTVDSGQGTVDS